MKDLFLAMKRLIEEGGDFVLVTLTAAQGSTPRGPGARMLVRREGRVWGTIGGALFEHLAIEEARSLIARGGGNRAAQYILHENEAADIGAKCGGEITVHLAYIRAAAPGLFPFVERALASFSQKAASWFIIALEQNTDAPENGPPGNGPPEGAGPWFCVAGQNGIIAALGAAPANLAPLLKNHCVLLEENKIRWFAEPLAAEGFVYIFGGGHIAWELSPLLSRLCFRCVVFDDRGEFSKRELFPDAEEVIRGSFADIGRSLSLGPADYAVILTRGHLWDFEAEAFALKSEARYIGVIGSRSKHAFVRERLLEAGFGAAAIDAPRVHAPIGVKIGSKTPAEVAVSIAAELIRARAGGD